MYQVNNIPDHNKVQLLEAGIMVKGRAYRRLKDVNPGRRCTSDDKKYEALRAWLKMEYSRTLRVQLLRKRLLAVRQGGDTGKQ